MTTPGVDRLADPAVIRLLLAIADTGRFSAAAARLGVSQPSVSQQVRRVEETVGRALFRRRRRGVELTADGEAVVVYARAMLGLTGELRDRLRRLAEDTEVTVGMSEDFCRTALPAVLRLFVRQHPTVRIRIMSGTYDTLAAAIDAGRVDFTIMRRYGDYPDAELLYREELAWIGGPDVALPVRDPVPLVLPLPPNPSRDTVLSVLGAAGREAVVRFESVGIAGMEMALGANLGVCAGPRLIPLIGAAVLGEGHGLPPLPAVEFVMVRAAGETNPAARAFADVLVEAARTRFGLPGEGRGGPSRRRPAGG